MKHWSFKVKVGVYAALLTIAALVAGGCVMMLTLYFYQAAELDEELKDDAEELVWDLRNFRDAPKDPSEPIGEEFIPVPLREHYLMVEGPEGSVVYKSSNLREHVLTGKVGETQTVGLFGDSCRVGAWREGPYVVRIGARMNMIQRLLGDIGVGIATSLPAVGLVVFFGGMWLGRRTVAPVAQLCAAAERINASNPLERLPIPPARDEIAKLTEVVNRSFDRLQASYELAIRFSADASHQLKTPVAILRAGLDHLSHDTELSESQSSEVATMRQQTRRLTSLIEDLLLLAQADAGRVSLEKREMDLLPLIQAACDDLEALVEGKGIDVGIDLQKSLPVMGDQRLLAMVIQNLFENASKYTPDGGIIRISGRDDSGMVVICIGNSGSQVPEAERELIFERFRRGSGTGGGVRGHGLGLNIARELARAHGGDVVLRDSVADWVEFEFRMPRRN